MKCMALKGNLLLIVKRRKPNLIRQQEFSISKSIRKATNNNIENGKSGFISKRTLTCLGSYCSA